MSNETFAFQAEINQLLSLIINTFYSNKDIFLRELISNASDALDKERFENLKSSQVSKDELAIRITPNKESGSLVIEDNGIGMNKDEMIKNLGTIAHSGTRAFMEAMQAGTDVSLIGQFGVGFYSAFLVADKVKVTSKAHQSDETWVWESDASGTFSVSPYEGDFARGTRIELHIKQDQKEYLEELRIREIIDRHSKYVGFPIYLYTEVVKGADAGAEAGAKTDREIEADAKENEVVEFTWDRVNKQVPIWTRKPEEVKHEEYASFYKTTYGDWEDHLAVKHFVTEGQVEYKAMLFIPPRAPYDMFTGGVNKKMNNIKLYVKRVLIMDESNELLPEYMSFIRGVVDSEDLPLNVSREMLQQNKIMNVIKKGLIKKTIDMLSDLATDSDKWTKFYEAFSKNLKLGVIEDARNKDKLVELLRFRSSKSGEDMVSLKDYVTRMKEDQKHIYYLTGESYQQVQNMACLERIKKEGYEVLFLIDPIDEYMIAHLPEYDGKRIMNCSKEWYVKEDEKLNEQLAKEWEPVCKTIQKILNEKVKEVKVSEKLVSRPCVVISDQYGWSPNMERIMKAQALRGGPDNLAYMSSLKKVLEINTSSNILIALKNKIESNGDEKSIIRIVWLLYSTALLDSGYSVEDPASFCSKIYNLIQLGLSGDDSPDEVADEEVKNEDVSNNEESKMEEVD